MKSKVLIGSICFVLGALAGYFGPGIVKAEIVAHQEDAAVEDTVETPESEEVLKEELRKMKEAEASAEKVKEEVEEEVEKDSEVK